MLLTAEKTRSLISGLTIAAFFLGLFLGYNNISIFPEQWFKTYFECSKGSIQCSDESFCNLDFEGLKGQCESGWTF